MIANRRLIPVTFQIIFLTHLGLIHEHFDNIDTIEIARQRVKFRKPDNLHIIGVQGRTAITQEMAIVNGCRHF